MTKVVVVLVALLGGCALAPAPPVRLLAIAPEAESGQHDKPGWQTSKFAVAAANPLAARAGYQILKAGGSAIDAAIAVQMVLTLVEPQSSGIGGGSLLLHFDGRSVQAFDGRETAPAAVDENLFTAADGKPMEFSEAVPGGRSVGVPGTVRMLELAHRQHGKLAWAALFEPAIELAERGFPVSARLHTLLATDRLLRRDAKAAAYFYDALGRPRAVGHQLQNPELAAVLRQIARQGSAALHQGPIAAAIVRKVRSHALNPGRMTLADLASYRALERQPICHDHSVPPRRVYRLCGFPPPSSGAIAIGQILGILQNTPVANQRPGPDGMPTPHWLHYYTEAARLAFADRAAYVADPDFVAAPAGSWVSLLLPEYLAGRAKLIASRAITPAKPGQPAGRATSYAPMAEQPEHGTSHISIVDAQGRSLAMTSSIESAFGSRMMVAGFLLNNELTDFSFAPRDQAGRAVANRVQPGKRPRSSMSPTLVFDKDTGGFVMSVGSPGGALIIHYTARTLWSVLRWGLNPQQAIKLPNFGTTGGSTLLERGRFSKSIIDDLESRGHTITEMPMTSGLQAIVRTPSGYSGGADPRREGVVVGD